MHLIPLLAALLGAATAAPHYDLLAHVSFGGYSLKLSDSNGAASAAGLVATAGAVATRSLSPAIGLGALVELTYFLPETSGVFSTPGFLIGPAAVFRLGALALTSSVALSVLGGGNGLGLGLVAAADVVLVGPLSLHFQASWRDDFPSGGRVSLWAGSGGLGLVY